MIATFYIAAAVAVLATVLAVSHMNIVHALLYLIVSLLAMAVVLFTVGAPFAAALEVIIYAGAILILFVFVIMMLSIGPADEKRECLWCRPTAWIGPGILAAALFAAVIAALAGTAPVPLAGTAIGAKAIGVVLFGPYLIGVELASFLLLAGLVGALHLGQRGTHEGGAP